MDAVMSDRNRRRENRVKVSWKAKVGMKGLGVGPALVRNVSLSGVYFEAPLALTMQSRILLESQIEHSGEIRPLLLECEVMRCASTERPEVHGYGARFVKLGKNNLSLLLPVIAELWIAQGKEQSIAPQPPQPDTSSSLFR